MSIQVSVHHNCRWAGAERFHIRVTVTDQMIATFVQSLADIIVGDDDDPDTYHSFGSINFGGKTFQIEDAHYEPTKAFVADPSNFTWIAVSNGSIQADLMPFQGGWNIDFSIQKEYGDDRDLDYMRYLDTGVEEELPECFWIEPASIVRAMLKA